MGKYLENQYEERDYALELAKKHKLLHEDKENKMTWEELKEEAKEMGYHFMDDDSKEYLIETDIAFTKGGTIYIELDDKDNRYILKRRRTPDQMFAIMKALQ